MQRCHFSYFTISYFFTGISVLDYLSFLHKIDQNRKFSYFLFVRVWHLCQCHSMSEYHFFKYWERKLYVPVLIVLGLRWFWLATWSYIWPHYKPSKNNLFSHEFSTCNRPFTHVSNLKIISSTYKTTSLRGYDDIVYIYVLVWECDKYNIFNKNLRMLPWMHL